MVSFKNWLLGKESKEVYNKTLLVVLILFMFNLIMSIILYSREFSFLSTQVSSLGTIRPESVGWIFFTMGLILVGILTLPHLFFLARLLKEDTQGIGYLSFVFLLIACIGIALVGAIPTNISYSAHLLAAAFAFGGLGAGAIFMLIPLRKRIKRGAEWPSYKILFVLVGPLIITMIVTIIVIGIPTAQELIATGDLVAAEIWALFEWLLVFASLYCFFGIVFSCKES